MNDVIVNPDKLLAMIMSSDKKENKYGLNMNNSIIISSVDYVTLLEIEIHNKQNFEKHISIIISFYIFLSKQCSLLNIYLLTVNVFKCLLILSENKESYLYYYYIKLARFSLDILIRSFY